MEVGFVDQCVESDAEPIEKIVDVVVEIHNLVDARIEICFHDQLIMFDMEIAEYLVMDNQFVEGDDLYVADMHISSVGSLVAGMVEDLDDTIDLCVPTMDLLVDFMFEDIVVASCD